MPVWHKETEALRDAGELQIVGIVQEQHPERAALYRQWQELDWPILVDSFNLMGLKAVPSFWGIDESGRWVKKMRKPGQLAEFMAITPVEGTPRPMLNQNYNALPKRFEKAIYGNPETDYRTQVPAAMASLLFEDQSEILETPKYLRHLRDRPYRRIDNTDKYLIYHLRDDKRPQALRYHLKEEELAVWYFRAGVFYRKQWEIEGGAIVAAAITAWQMALDAVPSQYIWRRRIEQYGPRLGKPYSFYDWIHSARKEINARGETPITLPIEPSGAEFAQPSRSAPAANSQEAPLREGIENDKGTYVSVKQLPITNPRAKGKAFRYHLYFSPRYGEWDPELSEIKLYIKPFEGGVTCSTPEQGPDTPDGDRVMEFDLHIAERSSRSGSVAKAYAFYHVCDKEDGVCKYVWQEVWIALPKDIE